MDEMGNDVLEAVIERLLSDDDLMGVVTDVVHISGEQGAEYPLCIVTDLPSRTAYTFGGLDSEKHFLTIEVVGTPTAEHSAYTNCKRALNIIAPLLQDLDGGLVTSDGTVICLRRQNELASLKDVESGGEVYVRKGHEWEIVVEQD